MTRGTKSGNSSPFLITKLVYTCIYYDTKIVYFIFSIFENFNHQFISIFVLPYLRKVQQEMECVLYDILYIYIYFLISLRVNACNSAILPKSICTNESHASSVRIFHRVPSAFSIDITEQKRE